VGSVRRHVIDITRVCCIARPCERELNGYLQERYSAYEMRRDCLNVGFTGELILLGTYEDSNFCLANSDGGRGFPCS
jgi:hypothetical protein